MRSLVLFDFDGTLSTCDSVTMLYKHLEPRKAIYLLKYYIAPIGHYIAFKFGLLPEQKVKELRNWLFLKGNPRSIQNKLTLSGFYNGIRESIKSEALENCSGTLNKAII